jgi:hypothetical protein
LTIYQKYLDPILKGHDFYIYYMIKLYLYTIYHHQLYTMKSLQNPYKILLKPIQNVGIKGWKSMSSLYKSINFLVL